MKEGKSFDISKHLVLEAYKSVKANKGVEIPKKMEKRDCWGYLQSKTVLLKW